MFPGFNNKKKGTISKGDWDRDGVSNRKDCEPLNFKRQDGGGQFQIKDNYGIVWAEGLSKEEAEDIVERAREGGEF